MVKRLIPVDYWTQKVGERNSLPTCEVQCEKVYSIETMPNATVSWRWKSWAKSFATHKWRLKLKSSNVRLSRAQPSNFLHTLQASQFSLLDDGFRISSCFLAHSSYKVLPWNAQEVALAVPNVEETTTATTLYHLLILIKKIYGARNPFVCICQWIRVWVWLHINHWYLYGSCISPVMLMMLITVP